MGKKRVISDTLFRMDAWPLGDTQARQQFVNYRTRYVVFESTAARAGCLHGEIIVERKSGQQADDRLAGLDIARHQALAQGLAGGNALVRLLQEVQDGALHASFEEIFEHRLDTIAISLDVE